MIRVCLKQGVKTTHANDRRVSPEHSRRLDGVLRLGVRVDVPVWSSSGLVLMWDATRPTNGTP